MPLEEELGSDVGFGPTEEERKSRVEENKQGNGEKYKSTLRVVSEEECKEELEDFLNPPVAPSNIEQSIRSGFLERPEKVQNMWSYCQRGSLLG